MPPWWRWVFFLCPISSSHDFRPKETQNKTNLLSACTYFPISYVPPPHFFIFFTKVLDVSLHPLFFFFSPYLFFCVCVYVYVEAGARPTYYYDRRPSAASRCFCNFLFFYLFDSFLGLYWGGECDAVLTQIIAIYYLFFGLLLPFRASTPLVSHCVVLNVGCELTMIGIDGFQSAGKTYTHPFSPVSFSLLLFFF